MNQLAANLRKLHLDQAMTQEQIAEKLGVSAQSVSRWENAATLPDVMLLPDIAKLYGVLVDDLDVREYPLEELRSRIGMVLQNNVLFTGTIRENLLWGREDATEEEIISAAKLANADSFIRRLPDGYDTMLTGDGANLSQGQRQLLAIARAAIADPPALILDEATSALDNVTERLVQDALNHAMKDRTVFVIAHRLSTVRNADLILVVKNGRIVEQGTHPELLTQKGYYHELYTRQYEDEQTSSLFANV